MLYMILDTTKELHLVKVGMTRNLEKRRTSYKTHNPFAVMTWSCAGCEKEELKVRSELNKIGKRVSGTEWFIVSEETYNELNQKGFAMFESTKLKKNYNCK